MTQKDISDKNKSPTIEVGYSQKIYGAWNHKHDISSPKFYEILLETDLKLETYLNVKNFYNYIKMCLNAVKTSGNISCHPTK